MEEIRDKSHGFVSQDDLKEIVQINRLELLLVRCGGCRFMAPAQDIERLIKLVESSGEEYVRDVSFPVRM
jgi:hypothetical protein